MRVGVGWVNVGPGVLTAPHYRRVVLALIPPAQTYIYGRVIAFFTDLPSVELLVVYMAAWLVVWLTGTVVNYKWEIVMPAASQRYALRAVLFKQLMRLKGDSAVLAKWSPGVCCTYAGKSTPGAIVPEGTVSGGIVFRGHSVPGRYHSEPIFCRQTIFCRIQAHCCQASLTFAWCTCA